MGTLYLVGTPIGNLEDITLRALRVLREVRLIAAEDTRRAKVLLSRYEIATPVVSFHAHSRQAQRERLVALLAEGDIALISDAGMPGISDPGAELVRAVVTAGHRVVVVPGPSAVTAAAALSGLVTDGFHFAGFLPRRSSERRSHLERLRDLSVPVILFEAPHRLRETLADALAILGDRPVAVCRELTKVFEEVWYTTLGKALAKASEQEPRGEFVIVIGVGERQSPQWDETQLRTLIAEGLARGQSPTEIARQLAKRTGLPRRELYRLTLSLRSRLPEQAEEEES